jgi:ketosteroid isomerase-like protein
MGATGEHPVRAFAEAITANDLERALEACHPDIEFLSVLAVSGRRYRGHAGIREYFEDIHSAWAEWRVEVHQVVAGDDGRVAIVMTMHVRGKESGAMLAERTEHLWTIEDGRLLRNLPFREPGGALRELGVEG